VGVAADAEAEAEGAGAGAGVVADDAAGGRLDGALVAVALAGAVALALSATIALSDAVAEASGAVSARALDGARPTKIGKAKRRSATKHHPRRRTGVTSLGSAGEGLRVKRVDDNYSPSRVRSQPCGSHSA
jgi:hypothetical protein